MPGILSTEIERSLSLADLDVAIGGVADHPLGAPLGGLLVDERGGVVAVVLVGGRQRVEVKIGAWAVAAAWSS